METWIARVYRAKYGGDGVAERTEGASMSAAAIRVRSRQSRIERMLVAKGPMSTTELAAYIGGSQSSNYAALAHMERRGLVRRLANERYWGHRDGPQERTAGIEEIITREKAVVERAIMLFAEGVSVEQSGKGRPIVPPPLVVRECLRKVFYGLSSRQAETVTYTSLVRWMESPILARALLMIGKDASKELSAVLGAKARDARHWSAQTFRLEEVGMTVKTSAVTGLVRHVRCDRSVDSVGSASWSYTAAQSRGPVWRAAMTACKGQRDTLLEHYAQFAETMGPPEEALAVQFGSEYRARTPAGRHVEAIARLVVYNLWNVSWALLAIGRDLKGVVASTKETTRPVVQLVPRPEPTRDLEHTFMLRAGYPVQLRLPEDVSDKEMARFVRWLETLGLPKR